MIWNPAPKQLMLSGNEVHVWRATLDLSASCRESLRQNLSTDELERTQRFHFNKDRARFVVGRGLLRIILGRYLNVDAKQLRFEYTSYGKPFLAAGFEQEALCFNLSHSEGCALYAIARGRKIGIDLERVRHELAGEQIAQRFFSLRELASLRTLPANRRTEMFFQYWTRKEACLKAGGVGLSFPLEKCEVSMIRAMAATPISLGGERQECYWYVQDLIPGFGYAAAIAVERGGWGLSCWQWE